MNVKSSAVIGMAFLGAAFGTIGAPMNALAQTTPVMSQPMSLSSNTSLSIPEINVEQIMAQCVSTKEERRGLFWSQRVNVPVVSEHCFSANNLLMIYQDSFNPTYGTELRFEIAAAFVEMLGEIQNNRTSAHALTLPNARHEDGRIVSGSERRSAIAQVTTLDEQLNIIDDGIKASGRFSGISEFLTWYEQNKPTCANTSFGSVITIGDERRVSFGACPINLASPAP
jgi:hypothetical protein